MDRYTSHYQISHVARLNETSVKDDYEQKYPEDSPGSECNPAARVWRILADECQAYDKGKIEVLRDNVDVLLVFVSSIPAIFNTQMSKLGL